MADTPATTDEILSLNEQALQTPPRATFGIRLGAYLLDYLYLILLAVLVAGMLQPLLADFANALLERQAAAMNQEEYDALMEALNSEMGGFVRYFMVVGIVLYPLGVLYYLLEALRGVSLGKMSLGLVIRAENGQAAAAQQLGVRYLLKVLPFVLNTLVLAAINLEEPLNAVSGIYGFAFFVGCFFVLGAKRQAFHDSLAKVAVYKKADLSA